MKLEKTFQHRTFWMGCAILIVMLYHAKLDPSSLLHSLINTYGYGATDIFLFASGIGCYYSLSKDPDILRFQKRRFLRLAPAYLCFIVPWLFWRNIAIPVTLQSALGNLLGLQFLLNHHYFNWYISGLILFYLLTPYFKQITDSRRSIWWDIAVTLFLILICIPFWNASSRIMILLSRLPVFYLGLVYARLAKSGCTLKIKHYILHFLIMLLGCALMIIVYHRCRDILWSHGLYWYPFILIIPGGCLLLSLLADVLYKLPLLKWICRPLEIMGAYSFELYLVHVFIYEHLQPDILARFGHHPKNAVLIGLFPVILILSFLLNKAAAILLFLVQRGAARLSQETSNSQ